MEDEKLPHSLTMDEVLPKENADFDSDKGNLRTFSSSIEQVTKEPLTGVKERSITKKMSDFKKKQNDVKGKQALRLEIIKAENLKLRSKLSTLKQRIKDIKQLGYPVNLLEFLTVNSKYLENTKPILRDEDLIRMNEKLLDVSLNYQSLGSSLQSENERLNSQIQAVSNELSSLKTIQEYYKAEYSKIENSYFQVKDTVLNAIFEEISLSSRRLISDIDNKKELINRKYTILGQKIDLLTGKMKNDRKSNEHLTFEHFYVEVKGSETLLKKIRILQNLYQESQRELRYKKAEIMKFKEENSKISITEDSGFLNQDLKVEELSCKLEESRQTILILNESLKQLERSESIKMNQLENTIQNLNHKIQSLENKNKEIINKNFDLTEKIGTLNAQIQEQRDELTRNNIDREEIVSKIEMFYSNEIRELNEEKERLAKIVKRNNIAKSSSSDNEEQNKLLFDNDLSGIEKPSILEHSLIHEMPSLEVSDEFVVLENLKTTITQLREISEKRKEKIRVLKDENKKLKDSCEFNFKNNPTVMNIRSLVLEIAKNLPIVKKEVEKIIESIFKAFECSDSEIEAIQNSRKSKKKTELFV